MNARVLRFFLQEEAFEFSKKCNVKNFTASKVWLESFKKKKLNFSENFVCKMSWDGYGSRGLL